MTWLSSVQHACILITSIDESRNICVMPVSQIYLDSGKDILSEWGVLWRRVIGRLGSDGQQDPVWWSVTYRLLSQSYLPPGMGGMWSYLFCVWATECKSGVMTFHIKSNERSRNNASAPDQLCLKCQRFQFNFVKIGGITIRGEPSGTSRERLNISHLNHYIMIYTV